MNCEWVYESHDVSHTHSFFPLLPFLFLPLSPYLQLGSSLQYQKKEIEFPTLEYSACISWTKKLEGTWDQ